MSCYQTISRKELAEKLKESRSTIDYVNPFEKQFYSKTFLVFLDTGCYVAAPFLIHANEFCGDVQDAICDYCDDKGYKGYFADDEYVKEQQKDALEQGFDEDDFINESYSQSGNFGKWFANVAFVYELETTNK